MDLKSSLNLVNELRREPAYEIQNALVHLLVALNNITNRRKELKRATGHLHRAHLDALKIKLYDLHQKFSNGNDKDKEIEFKRYFFKVRLGEIQSLVNDRTRPIEDFRSVIIKFNTEQYNQHYNIPQSAEAESAISCQRMTDQECALFWEWAQLEILHTSIIGQRVYDIVFNLIEAYLKSEKFADVLKEQIITLKLLIVRCALKIDYNNSLRDTLVLVENGASLLSTIEKIDGNMVDDSEEAAQAFSDDVTRYLDKQVFTCVLDFLNVSLTDLPKKLA